MDKRPLLYDLFCCAGGCTKGYQRAGFRVVGIDKNPQPRYCGDGFIQMDAIEFLDRYLDGQYPNAEAFSASPPCQGYSVTESLSNHDHPMMIPEVRLWLRATG